MKVKLVRTDLYITKEQHEYMKSCADKSGVTFSEMFRKAIDWYMEVKRDPKKKMDVV